MKKLITASLVGIFLSIVVGVMYYYCTKGYQKQDMVPAYATLLLEAFKILLTLSFVTIGGVFLKALVDTVLEKEKSNEVRINRHEESRKTILKEFATIFSEFYSIRKLYHSALSHNHIYEKNSNDFKMLLRELLQKSVDLEGRYGALKVMIITHFDLKSGDYQMKSKTELKKEIASTHDDKKLARLRLDLLGENYDRWRHAFEKNCSIKVGDEFWDDYDSLLKFMEKHK